MNNRTPIYMIISYEIFDNECSFFVKGVKIC